MSKEKMRDLLVCIVALIILALVVTTNVFAVDDGENIDNMFGDEANEIEEEENEVENNSAKNNSANNSSNKNNSNKNNSNKNNSNSKSNNNSKNNSSMPYTGLDNSVLFIIAIYDVSTVYAYKKIRDYKNV